MGPLIMTPYSKATQTMKLIASIALFASLCPLLVAADSKTSADPFAGAFFPPEMVLLAGDRIALTPQQRETFHARMEKTKLRSNELRAKLEHETAVLSSLAKQERVDEAVISTQLDKVLDVERELKHLHVGAAVALKNLLTPEQQAKLRAIAHDGGAQLMEATRKRLTEKVERINQGAQKWADSGRDPSDILKTMGEKFKPLLDAGKVIEAEAELDRLLERLAPDAK
jgi:Spy/CpxP family protein refolding chaperone